MKRFLILCAVFLVSFGAGRCRAEDRPVPAIQRAVVISIDGLRPDLLLRAATPEIHKLIAQGSFTFWARTTAMAITLPSHTSMLTGVTPDKHGIYWNSDLPLKVPIYPAWPTLFEVAKRAGYTTGMVAGKSKFATLAKPGTLDWQFIPDQPLTTDDVVVHDAVQIIHDHQPQVLFVHFPNVDTAGHAAGWGSAAQMAAIEHADACVGQVMAALDQQKLLGATFLILTSDHGGAGLSHGPDDERSRNIPWIAVGPGIRKAYDLTQLNELTVHTEDTFATVCYLLNIHPPRPIDGHAVLPILESRDLMARPG